MHLRRVLWRSVELKRPLPGDAVDVGVGRAEHGLHHPHANAAPAGGVEGVHEAAPRMQGRGGRLAVFAGELLSDVHMVRAGQGRDEGGAEPVHADTPVEEIGVLARVEHVHEDAGRKLLPDLAEHALDVGLHERVGPRHADGDVEEVPRAVAPDLEAAVFVERVAQAGGLAQEAGDVHAEVEVAAEHVEHVLVRDGGRRVPQRAACDAGVPRAIVVCGPAREDHVAGHRGHVDGAAPLRAQGQVAPDRAAAGEERLEPGQGPRDAAHHVLWALSHAALRAGAAFAHEGGKEREARERSERRLQLRELRLEPVECGGEFLVQLDVVGVEAALVLEADGG
eukprot:2393814-Rhodomonas_salina.1